MNATRRDALRFGLLAGAAAGTLAAPRMLKAQSAWPSEKPIQFIVPFPPGGGTDVNIRAMIPHFERHLPGARFIVINRPGAGGEIGYTAIATADGDGYTMGTIITPSLQTATIERKPRYTLDDFFYLGTIVQDPSAFHVAPDSPLRTLEDVVAQARKAPGKIAVGTAGIGSDDHLLMIGFERAAEVKLNHIPFAGQAPTITALMNGDIQIASMNIGESIPLIREGRVRPLATAGAERFPMSPDVPTFREAGYSVDTRVVRSLVVPATTPPETRTRLAEMVNAAMHDPQWIEQAKKMAIPTTYLSAEDTRALVFREGEALRKLWEEQPWRDQ